MRRECRGSCPSEQSRYASRTTCITCVTHVLLCMPGSLTRGLCWRRWHRKPSQHSRRPCNQQFYVSGKRPMECAALSCPWYPIYICTYLRLCQFEYTVGINKSWAVVPKIILVITVFHISRIFFANKFCWNNTEFMGCVIGRIHYGLKVVFCFIHFTAYHYHLIQECSQVLKICKCLWRLSCRGVPNMLLVLSITFYFH